MSKVRIISDGTPERSRVEVDGVELKTVQRVTFDLGIDGPATATITVVLPELDFEVENWTLSRPGSESEAGL